MGLAELLVDDHAKDLIRRAHAHADPVAVRREDRCEPQQQATDLTEVVLDLGRVGVKAGAPARAPTDVLVDPSERTVRARQDSRIAVA